MLAYYSSTKIEGPKDEVELILRLIQEAENRQARRSSGPTLITYPKEKSNG